MSGTGSKPDAPSEREELVERLLAEGVKPVSQALREVGIHVSAWTAIRWCRRGAAGHRLESVKVGGKWLTSLNAVKRFVASGQAQPQAGPCGQRNQTTVAAERFLDSIGLGRDEGACDRPSDS